MSCLSPVEVLTSLFREITELLHRKYDTPICGERACEIPFRATVLKILSNYSDKYPRHSFLPSVKIYMCNEQNNKVICDTQYIMTCLTSLLLLTKEITGN